jgi:ankyrin repeat protein
LQNAVEKDDLDIFRLLIKRGADVNGLGGYHGSPLGAAASRGSETMAKELLAHGADASAGQSCALFRSANEPLARLLLDAGADVNSQEGVRGKALQQAAWQGDAGLCRLLLDRGADVNAIGGKYGYDDMFHRNALLC